MVHMKRPKKASLIIIVLALLVCVLLIVVLRSRPDVPDDLVDASVPNPSGGLSFQVRVVVPRLGQPLGGILPDWIAKKLDGTPSELRFDHTSPGAEVSSLGKDRLELSADGGWNLLIETDGAGRVTPGTRLVFPIALGGRHVKLSCRPADRATGYLSTSTRDGSNELGGRFLVEFANCENAESGKATNWPPGPLTVTGSFHGLLQVRP